MQSMLCARHVSEHDDLHPSNTLQHHVQTVAPRPVNANAYAYNPFNCAAVQL